MRHPTKALPRSRGPRRRKSDQQPRTPSSSRIAVPATPAPTPTTGHRRRRLCPDRRARPGDRRWRPRPMSQTRCATRATGGSHGVPDAVRAGGVRRDRRPCPQEAATRPCTTSPTAACCPPTSCCSASPAATGRTATSRIWRRRPPASTRAPTGARRSGTRLSGDIIFVPGIFDDDEAFDTLAKTLDELRQSHGIQGNAAFYLSIPPQHVPDGAQADAAHRRWPTNGSAGRLAPSRRREAVRPRPAERARAEPARRRRVHARRTCSASTTTSARRPCRT